MKFLTHIFLAAGALFLLAACATDAPDEPAPSPDRSDEQLWISLRSMGQGELNSAANTRATSTNKSGDEQKIHKIVGLIFETDNSGNPSRFVAKSEINNSSKSPSNGLSERLLNFGLPAAFDLHKKYRLYVYSNFDFRLFNIAPTESERSFEKISQKTATVEALTPEQMLSKGLALATPKTIGTDLMVYFPGDKIQYPESNPYPVQNDVTSPSPELVLVENPATVTLTPLHARIDFSSNEGITDFTYPISFNKDTEKETVSDADVEVFVKFTTANIRNCGTQVYLEQQVSGGITSSPSGSAQTFADLTGLEVKEGVAAYIPEYVPSGSKLNYSNTTFIEFCGVISQAGKAASASVQQAITTTHADLYYYDDGMYQSALTTTVHTDDNWLKLSYDATLGGYPLTYRHAIRHSAGSDDGVFGDMEYGIVRNYIYQVGIKSVSALPHSKSDSDPIESGKSDINIRINPPTQWVYHRSGSIISFE